MRADMSVTLDVSCGSCGELDWRDWGCSVELPPTLLQQGSSASLECWYTVGQRYGWLDARSTAGLVTKA